MILDYDSSWPRRIDPLPPLPIQAGLDADLNMFYCKAEATTHVGQRIKREVKTEQGTIIKGVAGTLNKVSCEIGNPDPRNGVSPITQEDWLDDIIRHMPEALIPGTETPDVVIKTRAVFEPVPKKIEHMEDLGITQHTLECIQASEDVRYIQRAKSNQPHTTRDRTGIRNLANPYRIAKGYLLASGIIKSTHHPILRKIRSVLKTGWLLTDAAGYNDLGKDGILALELELIRSKDWTDIGFPVPFTIPYNSGIRGQVYRLMRNQSLVVV